MLLFTIKEYFLLTTFVLTQKLTKGQGYGYYVAAVCKVSIARIGAVSLLQSAWIMQNEQFCQYFAARCGRILQGRFGHRSLFKHLGPISAIRTVVPARNTPPFCSKTALEFAVCIGRHWLCSKVYSGSFIHYDLVLAVFMSSLRSVFVTFFAGKKVKFHRSLLCH